MLTTFAGILISPLIIILLKYRIILNYVFLLIVFALIATNTHNHDFYAYQYIFANPSVFTEPGYLLLVQALKILGANSHESVLLAFAILVILTFRKIANQTSYIYLVLFFYFLFLLPLDITQIRFGIASFVYLNAILYLSENKPKTAVFLGLISISFHIVMLIPFIILLFAILKLRKKSIAILTLFALFLSFVLFEYALKFALSSYLPVRTLSAYVSENSKPFSLFVWITPILATLLVYSRFERSATIQQSESSLLYNIIIRVALISLIFSPGLMYLHEFNRIYRLVLMLLLINGVLLITHLKLSFKIYLFGYLLVLKAFFGLYYSFSLNYDFIYWGLGEPRIN